MKQFERFLPPRCVHLLTSYPLLGRGSQGAPRACAARAPAETDTDPVAAGPSTTCSAPVAACAEGDTSDYLLQGCHGVSAPNGSETLLSGHVTGVHTPTPSEARHTAEHRLANET